MGCVLCCPSTATPKASPPPGLRTLNRLSGLGLRLSASPIGSAGKRFGRPLGVGAAAGRAPGPGQSLGASSGHCSRAPNPNLPGDRRPDPRQRLSKKGVCVLVARSQPQPALEKPGSFGAASAWGEWPTPSSRKGAFRRAEVPSGEGGRGKTDVS